MNRKVDLMDRNDQQIIPNCTEVLEQIKCKSGKTVLLLISLDWRKTTNIQCHVKHEVKTISQPD